PSVTPRGEANDTPSPSERHPKLSDPQGSTPAPGDAAVHRALSCRILRQDLRPRKRCAVLDDGAEVRRDEPLDHEGGPVVQMPRGVAEPLHVLSSSQVQSAPKGLAWHPENEISTR